MSQSSRSNRFQSRSGGFNDARRSGGDNQRGANAQRNDRFARGGQDSRGFNDGRGGGPRGRGGDGQRGRGFDGQRGGEGQRSSGQRGFDNQRGSDGSRGRGFDNQRGSENQRGRGFDSQRSSDSSRGRSFDTPRGRGSDSQRGQRNQSSQRKEKAKFLAIPGRMPVLEALKANRYLYEIFIDKTMADAIEEIVQLAAKRRVTVTYASRERMDNMVDGVRHQGILATTSWPEAGLLKDHLNHKLVVVLDGVTDPRNLGAIARSAEQAGAGCLIVRNRRAAGYSPAAEKASAGALSWIPMVTVSNINQTLEELHAAGMWTIGLAGEEDATPIWEEPLMRERVALVIGEEGEGMSRLVSQNCDARMSIPMQGHLDSLNASTAAAVALFEWLRLQQA